MSAGIERVFSECKKTCLRSRTHADTLKDIHLLRSWLKSGVLEGIRLPDNLPEEEDKQQQQDNNSEVD